MLIVACVYIHNLRDDILTEKAISRQNIAALDSMQKFIDDSTVMYQKYVSVQSINQEQEKLLTDRDEKILNLSRAVLQLKEIISKDTGTVINGSIGPQGYQFGTILRFIGGNEFYRYIDSIFLSAVPVHSLTLQFAEFQQKIFLTRNDKGLWSYYLKFIPDWVNKYIDVKNIEISVAKDEYLRVEDDINKFTMSLFLSGGLMIDNAVHLKAGGDVLVNNKHLIGYKHGIGNSYHYINYGYRIGF